jgi:hypothetical protein
MFAFVFTAAAQSAAPLFPATAAIQGGCIAPTDQYSNVVCTRPTLPVNPLITSMDAAYVRNTASLIVQCGNAASEGQIEGNLTGNMFFVDNFVKVTETQLTDAKSSATQNLCADADPVFGRCFNTDDQANKWADGSEIGLLPLRYYTPVSPKTFPLWPGSQVVKVQLMDGGAIYANSDIYLNPGSSCTVPATVTFCHKPTTPAEMQMTLPNSAVIDHLGHGDTLGACAPKVTGIPVDNPVHNGKK